MYTVHKSSTLTRIFTPNSTWLKITYRLMTRNYRVIFSLNIRVFCCVLKFSPCVTQAVVIT